VATNIEPQLCEPKTFDIRVDTSSESPVLMATPGVSGSNLGGVRGKNSNKNEKNTWDVFFAVAKL